MAIKTERFIRKPLLVDAVRVTEENFLEIAFWCKGSIKNIDGSETKAGTQIDPSKQLIRVRVHKPMNDRQATAKIGDWILKTDRGYKVYTDKGFQAAFDKVEQDPNDYPKGETSMEQDHTQDQQETMDDDTINPGESDTGADRPVETPTPEPNVPTEDAPTTEPHEPSDEEPAAEPVPAEQDATPPPAQPV